MVSVAGCPRGCDVSSFLYDTDLEMEQAAIGGTCHVSNKEGGYKPVPYHISL